MKSNIVRFYCLLLVLVSAMFAQEFRATLSGEVTDPAGAAIDGAKVVATSVERNTPYEALTNAVGRYIIQGLNPGKYTLTIERAGFKKFVREGVVLVGSDKAVVDGRLDLGAVSDSITVTGDVSLLQTETATRQTAFENRILENVPSGGRNSFALMYDQPGVVKNSGYWGSMELYAAGNFNGVTISGGRPSENESVLDGMTNTQSSRNVAFVPSINSTQEFTVQTNSYDAQFGRVGGGITMINLKSGTNGIHGQLFDYFKNDKIRANSWNANKVGNPNVPFKNNTFGFEADGPFYIPKVFDGRNKAFFMISLEGLREHDPSAVVTSLPLAPQLGGDFSGLQNGSGNQVTIYDPLTTALGPDGKTYVRTPFAGNKLPANRLNPIATKLTGFYPASPTFAGDPFTHFNNYAKVLAQYNGYDSWLGKMDYMISEKQRVSFHYGQTPWLNHQGLYWGNNPAEPSTQWPSTRIFRSWAADWTYTVTPSLVANIRTGLSRYEGQGGNTFGVGYDPRQLGFPSSLVSQFSTLMFPRFNIGNYSPIGANGVFSYSTDDSYSLQPNISWTKGRHFLKIGAEFRRYNDNSQGPGLASGNYTFDTGYTGAVPGRSDNISGNEFASFLLGYPVSGSVDKNIYPAYRSKYYAAYVQDDFKVSTKLTLNLGLRWDYESPRYERYDRVVTNFAFNQASPIAAATKASPAVANCPACAAGLTGGLVYAGTSGDDRYFFAPKRNQFQPRIGVAYRANQKLVFRGGFAISYLGQSSNGGGTTGYSRSTPLVSSLDGLTPAVSLSDPFPASIYPTGLLQPIGNSQGLSTNLGLGATFPYRDRPLPYSEQYSAGFQYEFPGHWLLDASYVGNITHRLPVNLGLNFIPANVLTSLPVDQRQAYFTAQVANPMAGQLPSSSLNGATIQRQLLLYAYPQYTGVTETDVPIGHSRYDGGQFKLARRFAHGFTTTASYTVSKTIEAVSVLNAQDVNLSDVRKTPLEHRIAQYDVPRQFSIIGTYDLPFGKGRPLMNHWNKYANAVLGGWTLSGIYMSHTGFPLAFPNAAPLVAQSARLTDQQRDQAAQAAGRSQYDVSYDNWFNTSPWRDPATGRIVSTQAPFTLRNFPTRFPDVRTKPLNVSDISIYKEFVLHEKVKWQVRVDAHNVGNFPWFSSLDSNGANVSSSQFGHLNAGMGNEQRLFVIVMKILF